MSKSKKRVDLSSEKAIQKEFGKVISAGIELVEAKKDLKVQSVSPALDLALNGGMLEGSWNLVSGDPKTGKSTTCLQICKNAQDNNRPVIYVDAESRLKAYNLVGTQDLDLEKIQVVHGPDDGDQLAAEDFLKICESMLKMPKNQGAVCVIDSCSSLVPRAELEEDPSATLRASLPDCGVMVQYQADTRMDIARIEPWLDGEKKIGQLIHWKITCSSLGASGTECVSYLKFGKGIDKDKEIIELAESFSIIDKSGAWYTLDFLEGQEEFKEPPKFQGQAKVYDFLESRPDIFKILFKKVQEVLA